MNEHWHPLRERLTRDLRAIGDRESLVLHEPDPPATPPPDRPWWRRWASRSPSPVGRYVQFSRFGDDLLGECVSGAYREISESQHAALLALGWSDPAGIRSDNYQRWARRGDEEQLAADGVAALRAIGGRPDAAWVVDRIR